jgi:hypothetical protein
MSRSSLDVISEINLQEVPPRAYDHAEVAGRGAGRGGSEDAFVEMKRNILNN